MGSGEGFTLRNFAVCTVHLIVRVIKSIILRWAGHVARMKECSDYKILTGTPTGKRPLGKPRRRWEYNMEWTLNRYQY